MQVTNKELCGLIYKTVRSICTKSVGCARKPKTAYTIDKVYTTMHMYTCTYFLFIYHSPPRNQGTTYPALFKPTTINGQCKAAHKFRNVTFLTDGTLQWIISEKKKTAVIKILRCLWVGCKGQRYYYYYYYRYYSLFSVLHFTRLADNTKVKTQNKS